MYSQKKQTRNLDARHFACMAVMGRDTWNILLVNFNLFILKSEILTWQEISLLTMSTTTYLNTLIGLNS